MPITGVSPGIHVFSGGAGGGNGPWYSGEYYVSSCSPPGSCGDDPYNCWVLDVGADSYVYAVWSPVSAPYAPTTGVTFGYDVTIRYAGTNDPGGGVGTENMNSFIVELTKNGDYDPETAIVWFEFGRFLIHRLVPPGLLPGEQPFYFINDCE